MFHKQMKHRPKWFKELNMKEIMDFSDSFKAESLHVWQSLLKEQEFS